MTRKIFFTVLILTAILLNLGFTMPSYASDRQERTITVTGEGVASIPTTNARVQLGVEIQGTEAATVQQEVATRSDALVKFLRSRQVEKLETTGINLQPNYNYSNNQRQLVGYTGTNIVSFQLETEKIGGLLDEAVKVGATRIDNISFTASEEAIDTARQTALVQATEQAQKQAKTVLKALGFAPKETISIQIGNASNPVPITPMVAMSAPPAASRAATPVIGGEQTVNAFVTLEIRY